MADHGSDGFPLAATQHDEFDERSTSPPKRTKRDPPDADALLDELLSQQARHAEIVPAWVSSLQLSVQTGFAEVKQSLNDYNARLTHVEAITSQPARDPRVDALVDKVDMLTKAFDEQKKNQAASTPNSTPDRFQGAGMHGSDAWSVYLANQHNRSTASGSAGPAQNQKSHPAFHSTPPRLQQSEFADLTSDTNFNHVIIGGWQFDTPRRFILSDMDSFLKRFRDPLQHCVERTVVYGQRAQVGHLFLKPLTPELAAERFYSLQDRCSNCAQTASGDNIWLAPSRTAERRSKNRATRRACDFLSSLWAEGHKPELEIGWGRQVVWISGKRVASGSASALFPTTGDKVVSRVFENDGDIATFHFNVHVLQTLTGKTHAEIEASLQSYDR